MTAYTGVIAVDTETNGEDIRDGRGFALGVSLAWRDSNGLQALYLPFRHIDSENCYTLSPFKDKLQTILLTHPIVFHNAKFDLSSLATLGLEVNKVFFYDTMVLAHLLNEELPYQGKGLDDLCKYYLKNDGKQMSPELAKFIATFGWARVPAESMSRYAAWDAALTLQLWEYFLPLLKREGIGAYWKEKVKFIHIVRGMEKAGVLINQEFCNSQAAAGHARMDEISREIGFSPSGRLNLKKLLIDTLHLPYIYHPKTNAPTFNKDAMLEYEVLLSHLNNPIAQLVLEFRGWQKAVSSNYEPYVRLLSPDGRLRPNYTHHRVKTGRMSCEMPNLQQIPKVNDKPWNGGMKSCFVAKPGYKLLEVDYSQLELRLGTAYAEDATLMQVFKEKRDIFTEMSLQLGLTRFETKTLVYSMQYGAGLNRISTVFNVPVSKAAEIRNNYFSTYPGFKKANDVAKRIVEQTSKIQLWSGRYRHFLDASYSHKAFNSVIQGGAADVVEAATIRCDTAGFNNSDCRLLLHVHDSLVWEVREDIFDKVVPEIQQVMTAVPEPFENVTFAADAHEWGKS